MGLKTKIVAQCNDLRALLEPYWANNLQVDDDQSRHSGLLPLDEHFDRQAEKKKR